MGSAGCGCSCGECRRAGNSTHRVCIFRCGRFGLSRDRLIESWMARSEAETWFWIQRYKAVVAAQCMSAAGVKV